MARPISTPAAAAMALLARTPQETTTTSAGMTVPSARWMAPFSYFWVEALASTRMPFCSKMSWNMRDAAGSSLLDIRDGMASSTVTLHPYFFSSQAASRPTTPPPMTTAFLLSPRKDATLAMSARVRMVVTWGSS